jgi:hypothetical protein
MLDRIPFIKKFREKKRNETLRKYLGELGIAGFVAILWLTAALAALEMLIPGFASDYISPGALVVALAVTGGLALLGPAEPRKRRQTVLYAGSGVLAAVGALYAAWYYFGPIPDVRSWMALATGVTVAALFTVFESNKVIE